MFNKSQEEAICHGMGPALVLAGPGSGKTTVITHRVKKLIEQGVKPENILVVTFTKAAAVEMQQRFLKLINHNGCELVNYPVTFGTFHSIFFRIIKDAKGSNYSILSEREKGDVIKEIVIRLKIDTNDMQEFVNCIIGEISKVKGNGIKLEEYEPLICSREKFVKIYTEYKREINRSDKIDFDDMVIRCHDVLKTNRELRKKWQEKFTYILIDEFQDINRLQYENIKILAEPENNIFIVGDDDQAIYGFRGSKPKLMFDFKNEFPDCREILLNINYRCPENVLKLSLALIGKNSTRFPKKIEAYSTWRDKADIRIFNNQKEEFDDIADKIMEYNRKGIEFSNIAVLVRNNSQIDFISEILANNRITVNAKKQKDNIYNTMVGKDIIAYIKSSFSDLNMPLSRNENLLRIINKPVRFISRQVMNEKNISFYQLKRIYGHNDEIMENIRNLEFHLKFLKTMNPNAAVLYIKNGCGYEKYLQIYARDNNMKFSNMSAILEEIQMQAQRFRTLNEWISYIDTLQVKEGENVQGVNVITMHSAKGLEFEAVFIPDANQGLIPSARAIRQQEIEEERRLFYVAMTRTKRYLHIYGMRQNLGNKLEMSQFVGEALQF